MRHNSLSTYVCRATFLLLPFMLASCTKYLEKKRDEGLATPASLADLQAVVNRGFLNGISAVTGEYMANDHFMTAAQYNAQGLSVRELYTWDSKGDGYSQTSWLELYEIIYQCNFILDYVNIVPVSNAQQQQAAQLTGDGLFGRAFAFYVLAQIYCKPYSASAATDPGIVLRTTSTVSAPSKRATVQATYDQIIADLKAAAGLLTITHPLKTEPTRMAAHALLARVYLSMRDYPNALVYAEKALAENSTLLDYNTLPASGASVIPLPPANPEVLFISTGGHVLFDVPFSNVDSTLYASYAANDLRKSAFFTPSGNTGKWKGSYGVAYDGAPHGVSTGPTVDELYLIRAECKARAGDKDAAMADLNALLVKRWRTGTYTDLAAADAADALQKVLTERRKELLFRDLRRSDLRRFNLEGANISLTRIINAVAYTLAPDDKRWVALIPEREIMYSGIEQNPR